MANNIAKNFDAILNNFKEFCNITSFHGFKLITIHGNRVFDSLFWVAICISSFVMAVFMSDLFFTRIHTHPTITTIDTIHHPISSMPFPSITICNQNIVYLPAAERLIAKAQKLGFERIWVEELLKMLPGLLKPSYNEFNKSFINESELLMKSLGFDNVGELFLQLTQPCDHLIYRCYWLSVQYNCSRVIQRVVTPYGYCCSFNWHVFNNRYEDENEMVDEVEDQNERISEDYEKFNDNLRVVESGDALHGSTLFVDSELNNYFAVLEAFYGSTAYIHHPRYYPESEMLIVQVEPDEEINAEMSGEIVSSTDSVRNLRLDRRKCLFDGEIKSTSMGMYSVQNCMAECRSKFIERVCGCVPFYYPVVKNKICGFRDVACVRNHKSVMAALQPATLYREDGKYDNSTCPCLPRCATKSYSMFANSNKINDRFSSIFYPKNTRRNNMSVLNVYFKNRYGVKYNQESTVTWDSIFASIGGIFGICFGGSLICFIEVIYWATTRFCANRKIGEIKATRIIFVKKRSTPLAFVN